jgi:hypothetical protein
MKCFENECSSILASVNDVTKSLMGFRVQKKNFTVYSIIITDIASLPCRMRCLKKYEYLYSPLALGEKAMGHATMTKLTS